MTYEMDSDLLVELATKFTKRQLYSREEATSFQMLSAISDCLDIIGSHIYDVSTSWVFALCHMQEPTLAAKWPNPKHISMASNEFVNDSFHHQAVLYYIQFTNSLLTAKSFPAKLI